MPMVAAISDKSVDFEKGYYHGVYAMLHFKKGSIVDRKENQADMDPYPDEEEIQDVMFYDKRERQQMMVFKENYGGVGKEKMILHAKRWDVYINKKKH